MNQCKCLIICNADRSLSIYWKFTRKSMNQRDLLDLSTTSCQPPSDTLRLQLKKCCDLEILGLFEIIHFLYSGFVQNLAFPVSHFYWRFQIKKTVKPIIYNAAARNSEKRNLRPQSGNMPGTGPRSLKASSLAASGDATKRKRGKGEKVT